MSKPTFVYTTYIRTTPEQLWKGLTDPAFTKRYWNTTFETDWQVGSPMVWDNQGVRIDDPEQVVLECRPVHPPVVHVAHRSRTELADAVGLQRRAADDAGRRASVDGDLRHRGPAAHGEADRDPRDRRSRQPRALDGERRLAAGPGGAEDAARDRPGAVGVRRLTDVAAAGCTVLGSCWTVGRCSSPAGGYAV